MGGSRVWGISLGAHDYHQTVTPVPRQYCYRAVDAFALSRGALTSAARPDSAIVATRILAPRGSYRPPDLVQEGLAPQLGGLQIPYGLFTRAAEVADGFVFLRRAIDRGEIA
jgi:hypothetical protein